MKHESTRLRRTPRAPLHQPVRIGSTPVLLMDISESGLRLKGLPRSLRLSARDTIEVMWNPLPGLKEEILHARVRWTRGDEAGLTLRQADPRVRCLLRALVRYHRSSARPAPLSGSR